MLPQFISRVRSGVNRLFRWRKFNPSTGQPDPVHLSSCLLDFWYSTVNPTAADGLFLVWTNSANPPEQWVSGSPGYLYRDADGVYNKGGGNFVGSSTRTLAGALTLYWLADYAGVTGVPLISDVNGAVSVTGTTAKITNDANSSKTKDGTLSGNRLYRWRRTSANACFFKPGDGTEVSFGTLAGNISFNNVIPIGDDNDNRTRRVLLYNVDLVEQGIESGVEAGINDITVNQVTLDFAVSGTWAPGSNADLTRPVLFESYGKGSDGGPAGAGGAAGGSGGGYAAVTAPSLTGLGFTASSKFVVTIDVSGNASVTDPNSLLLVSASVGGSYLLAGNENGGTGYAEPANGYIAQKYNQGGRSGNQGYGGGGGGGGSGGRAGNGAPGRDSTSAAGGIGGTVNYGGGTGGTVGGAGPTAGTTPGGGGGGAASDGSSGGTAGAAVVRITFYINSVAADSFGALTGNDILTITNNATVPRVTTAAPHGLSNGASITISGNSVIGYNGGTSATVISATVFDTDLLYTADGTGGRWD